MISVGIWKKLLFLIEAKIETIGSGEYSLLLFGLWVFHLLNSVERV